MESILSQIGISPEEAQSCLETGNFGFSGSAVTLDQNNFCGMGVTSNGMKGNSFATQRELANAIGKWKTLSQVVHKYYRKGKVDEEY